MNKKILIAIVVVLFAVPVALYLKDAFTPKEVIVFDQTNSVFVVKGDVKVKKAAEPSAWQKVETSTVLGKGDVVETSKDSTVNIIIGSNNEKAVKIDESSRVEFKEINPTSLDFSKGKILVAIKKLEPKSSFVVKTPTAVCGARGTGWSEETSADKTRLCVFEDEVFLQSLDTSGKPKRKKHTASEGTERLIEKDKPVGDAKALSEKDLETWRRWDKNINYIEEGKILINDFERKENFNNLDGPFGSWNTFYYDTNQFCRDEFAPPREAGKGYSLKLIYDVQSPYSAYNGFFTNLMGIDITDYKYIVFYIKGDKPAGFTKRVNIELKNNKQTGRTILEGITEDWKKRVVPIKSFGGINNFKEMKEFVIVFSDIGVTKKEGAIYIDDIYFAKEEES